MYYHRLRQRIQSVMLIAVAALFIITIPTQASVCTLEDNIKSANTNTAVGFCPAGTSHDVITIAEDVTLSEPLPPITGTITIEGGGHTISGANQFRIFDVIGANLTIKNLTMRDGTAPDGEYGGAIRASGAQLTIADAVFNENAADYGGAIMTTRNSRLNITRSSFRENSASDYGGAIYAVGAAAISSSSFVNNRSADSGGALVTSIIDAQVSNSTFYGNSAQWDGGAVFHFSGDLTLTHVTLSGNRLNTGYKNAGQAITNQTVNPSDGSLNLRNSIVTGTSPHCVGGLGQFGGNLSPDGSCSYEPGGAPRLGALTGSPAYLPLLDQSDAIDRTDPEFCLETDQIGNPRPQGGGCDIGAIESATAMPAPTPTPTICTFQDQIIAANTDKAYRSCPAGDGADTIYMIRDHLLSEPLAAIKTDITIEGNGHTINGNRRFFIFNVDGGRLTVNNATLTKGTSAIRLQNGGQALANGVRFIANGPRGAISSKFPVYIEVNDSIFLKNSSAYDGGAIGMNGGGVANIKNSSFVQNRAAIDGGAIGSVSASLYVSNSSFIRNSASHDGGAVSAVGGGTSGNAPVAWLTHVTMLDNRAREGMAIWIAKQRHNGSITLRLRNSIIARSGAQRGELCVGRLSQNLNNLIEDGSCSPMLSGDPMFEEVAEDATIIPLSAGSPAIDADHREVCPESDQIGSPRPLGNGCDLGALETLPVVEALPDCRVTPTHNLNFRDGPWGNIIGVASYTTTFVAKARTTAWFEVAPEDEGTTGWISALHVRMEGDCG